mmetsp:Transcript_29050/g.37494  ORF Transcript_29050/g.37494 Transcript_29050/m.37494 type:complete len:362 (-) Transcript_29050:84-1169(-)
MAILKAVFILSALTLSSAEENVPLNSYPMIMSHDAGSGYLQTFRGIKELVLKWTMTQSAGFTEQLECGARAFDARPAVNGDGELVWHHGDIVVNYSFVSSMNEVIEWCGANQDELVLMDIVDCNGDGCNEAVTTALEDLAIPSITTCDWFNNASLSDAREAATLSNGGQLLALIGGCTQMNYEPSIACSGYNKTKNNNDNELLSCFDTSKDLFEKKTLSEQIEQCTKEENEELLKKDAKNVYRCYDDDITNEFPINRMFEYLDNTSASYDSSFKHTGQLWQMQSLWEETDASVALGTLARSSLLEDEVRSSLNNKLTSAVEAGRWSDISLLEVNNVCDGGPALFTALRNWWSMKQKKNSSR